MLASEEDDIAVTTGIDVTRTPRGRVAIVSNRCKLTTRFNDRLFSYARTRFKMRKTLRSFVLQSVRDGCLCAGWGEGERGVIGTNVGHSGEFGVI